MSSDWDWPGSRWWAVDLHAHSPASYDFKPKTERENPDWPRWIEAARDAGLHAIAVTDHVIADGISPLQAAVSTLSDAPVIFPGFELTASDGSHLLLLMDPSRTQTDVDYLLSRMKIPPCRRGKQTSRTTLSVEGILNECDEDVLVLGAHVNGPDGLIVQGGLQRIGALNHPNLAAADVDPRKSLDARWLDGSLPQIKRRISQVWSSDGHRYKELGRRITWVKMTRPDLGGLRLALLDGAQSLQTACQGSLCRGDLKNPNAVPNLAIESVKVQNAKYVGRSSPLSVSFNPWFNAIIGGRGTGKSTLIDFCRKALGRESELDDSVDGVEGSLRVQFDNRMRVPSGSVETGLLTHNTSIEVVYRKDGDRFVMSWQEGDSGCAIHRLDGDQRIPEAGNVRERFPARLYSQKQLFALAQDPNALMSVIDDSQVVSKADVDRSLEQLSARYLSLRAEARFARSQSSGLSARGVALADVERKLVVLQQGGHADAFTDYRLNRQLDAEWRGVLDAVAKDLEFVETSSDSLSVTELSSVSPTNTQQTPKALKNAHQALKRKVEEFKKEVLTGIEKTQQSIKAIVDGDDVGRWQGLLTRSETRYREASFQLEQAGISTPDEYDEYLGRAEKIRKEIAVDEREITRATELDKDAEKVLAAYRKTRRELTRKRERFAAENSNDTVGVDLKAFRNHDDLHDKLAEILGTDRFLPDRIAIAQKILPASGQTWNWDKLDELIDDLRSYISQNVGSWEFQDRRFEAVLKATPPERLDRLALYLPGDTVTVSFNDTRGDGWRSLALGSPGQQTASLLTFVLGFGSEPIILDQPEDDLDSALIYDLLVKRLREVKQNRQVIVVSHNPNIVVHGDAELVVSLKAANGETRINCQGGLQERLVRDEICNVMEGGSEAFQSRYQRIMSSNYTAQRSLDIN